MIGHLPASVGLYQRDCAGIEDMGPASGLAEGEYRWMFYPPDLVAGAWASVIGEAAHR